MKRIFLLLVLLPFIFKGLAQKDVPVIGDLQQDLFNTQILNPQHSHQHLKAIKSATIYKLDTIVYNFNPQYYMHPLEPHELQILTYDEDNYVIYSLYKLYDEDSSDYVDIQKTIYTRDENHNVIEELIQTGYGELSPTNRILYNYDPDGNLIESKYQYYSNDIHDWVNSTLDSSYYDSFGNQILKKEFYWDNSTSTWNFSSVDSFYYESGYLIRKVSYFWDYELGELVLDMIYVYDYDENGNKILFIRINNNLDTIQIVRYYYNSDNLLVKDTIWGFGSYGSDYLGYAYNSVFQYDDNNNWIGAVRQRWDTTGHIWINYRSSEITYNTAVSIDNAVLPDNLDYFRNYAVNIPVRLLYKFWQADTGYWYNKAEVLYKYETIITSSQSVSNPQQIALYPNPASNVVNINLPDEQQAFVTIYDAKGRVVHTTQLVTGQVSVKSLPTGTYFLVVQGKNKVYVGKFLKK